MGDPLEAYLESMEECLTQKSAVPQWYLAIENSQIIGGIGVIENDFHNRKDLAPQCLCCLHRGEEKKPRCSGGTVKHRL